ncbi:MAG: hypothetical protein M4579_007032 [Chaenotheca gracillima]|nr:MAG: hypothetical protein M4579_007032 [Chaenotheca gracillima]
MLNLCLLSFVFTSLALVIYAEQIPIVDEELHAEDAAPPQRVAIIGAGIAGASAAYWLRDSGWYRVPIVDVYEAESRIGGRVSTECVHDKRYGNLQLQTGAEIFYTDDQCLQKAINEVGIRGKLSPHYPVKRSVGVWDGQNFIFRAKQDLKSRTWRDLARSVWQYGLSPARLKRLVETKIPQFKAVAGARQYLTRNLPESLDDHGLSMEYKQSAEQYLFNHSISPNYSREVIQATTRAWFGHDLHEINGLAGLVAMNAAETDEIMPTLGGMYSLIDRQLKLSGANLHLNSRVTKISRSNGKNYLLTVEGADPEGGTDTESTEYDTIIIATPLQGSGLELDLGVTMTDTIPPYVERHITHFMTSMSITLSPSYFNVSSYENIPRYVFTTPRETDDGSTDPGFFHLENSVTTVGLAGCIPIEARIFKIFSAAPIEDGMIAELFGQPRNSTLEDIGVRWVHRRAWPHASPKFRPGAALLNNFEIASRVFYTGASEEIVSSLEMSCRMGRRTADLAWYSVRRDFDSESEL